MPTSVKCILRSTPRSERNPGRMTATKLKLTSQDGMKRDYRRSNGRTLPIFILRWGRNPATMRPIGSLPYFGKSSTWLKAGAFLKLKIRPLRLNFSRGIGVNRGIGVRSARHWGQVYLVCIPCCDMIRFYHGASPSYRILWGCLSHYLPGE